MGLFDRFDQTIVIGGGVVGLLTALEIANTGRGVLLIEKGLLGQESSWAGAGILLPLYPWKAPEPVNRLWRYSMQHLPEVVNKLRDATGIDPEYDESGLYVLKELEVAQAVQWSHQMQTLLKVISGRTLKEQSPNILCAQDDIVLHMPHCASIRNPRFLQALVREVQSHKRIHVWEMTQVLNFSNQNGKTVALFTSRGPVTVNRVVICAGAWSGQLCQSLGLKNEIAPVKGQMLLFNPGESVLTSMVLKDGQYLTPRRDGRILAGSTLEQTGFANQPTCFAYESLLEFAQSVCPLLEEHCIEAQWSGLRPGVSGGVPWIGRHPRLGNVFINSGHFRHGLSLALGSARIIRNLLDGYTPEIETIEFEQGIQPALESVET